MEARTERVVSDTPAEDSLEHHHTAPARDRSAATSSSRSPRPADPESVSVLRGGVTAPRRARHEVAGLLNGELATPRKEDVVLLVGELVANCVVHADAGESDEIVMEILIGPDVVRVAVTDSGSSSVPTVRRSTSTLEGGRGLLLVEQLSDRWGITREGDRLTRVWFEMLREHQDPT
jgi:anti-sigma regulatory factor (Ser/Thr protein kinase)